jgi:hypothetical protein
MKDRLLLYFGILYQDLVAVLGSCNDPCSALKDVNKLYF